MVYIYVLRLQQGKYYVGKTDNPDMRLDTHFQEGGSVFTKKYKPIEILEIKEDCTAYDEQHVTQEYMEKYGIENVRGGPWTTMLLSDGEETLIQKMIDSKNDTCYHCGEAGHFIQGCPQRSQTSSIPSGLDDMTTKSIPWLRAHIKSAGLSSDDCIEKSELLIRARKASDFLCRKVDTIFMCKFCGKEFESQKGCRFHENIHCKQLRSHYETSYDRQGAARGEICNNFLEGRCRFGDRCWRQHPEYDSYDSYDSDESSDDGLRCYRCGRDSHLADTCYAKRHISGYVL